jgi:hypothetical protein
MLSARSNLRAFSTVVGLAIGSAGCAGYADYHNHRDTVTLRAGDAVYANAAIQTVDPWPPEGFEIVTLADGQRVLRAIKGYTAPRETGGDKTVNVTVN